MMKKLYKGELCGGMISIREDNPGTPVTLDRTVAKTYTEEDADRTVACVNACEGISNEALEGGVIEKMIENIKRDAEYYGENSSAQVIVDLLLEEAE